MDEVVHWGLRSGHNGTEFPFRGLFVSTLGEAGR